jgi:ADP-heptose:LPS heptosyltransferase
VSKQVLIVNITRLGDVIQTVPLINRLHHEWPDVAIDLVVDQRLEAVAGLLTGLRHVITRDFHDLRSTPATATTLSSALVDWAATVATTVYDRVINLTFTPQSGRLAALFQVPDTRGVTIGHGGTPIVKNSWLAHVVDLQQTRRVNRFNLVDLYALGGSGPGPFCPIRLSIPSDAEQWATQRLLRLGTDRIPIAVQIGANQARKAWRPEYFGRTMAAMNRERNVAFVLNSPKNEVDSVQQAVRAYQQAGGVSHACDIIENADVPQLAAVLRRCRLLLTNDTGPMHLAVGVGTPVIDLSVGHVDFRETGPYGPGHWVIQPVLDCSPCSFAQACTDHACKDQIMPDQVAALAMHVLGRQSFPESWTGVRVYESAVDADGLACYRPRAGVRDTTADWYGTFWRHYWYQEWTGQARDGVNEHPIPDLAEVRECFHQLIPRIDRLRQRVEQFLKACCNPFATASVLTGAQDQVAAERQQAFAVAMGSPAFGPVAAAVCRELYERRGLNHRERAYDEAHIYRMWQHRLYDVMGKLEQERSKQEAECVPARLRVVGKSVPVNVYPHSGL